jgi:hypothetical protein
MLDAVVHTCNSSTWEMEAERPCLNQKQKTKVLGCFCMPADPATLQVNKKMQFFYHLLYIYDKSGEDN